MSEVSLRQANASDMRFVAASWFTSYKNGGSWHYCPEPAYARGMDARILKCAPQTIIAYVTDIPDEVVSWLAIDATGDTLHYVYTKKAYRKLGFAKRLLSLAPALTAHTHETRSLKHLKLTTTYDPFFFERAP